MHTHESIARAKAEGKTILTLVSYEDGTLYARQIAADAASGDLVFLGTPTNREIRQRADELLACPFLSDDGNSYGDYRLVPIRWEFPPVLSLGQWLCARCDGVCDESDGYAETHEGPWCETCCDLAGVDLDVTT